MANVRNPCTPSAMLSSGLKKKSDQLSTFWASERCTYHRISLAGEGGAQKSILRSSSHFLRFAQTSGRISSPLWTQSSVRLRIRAKLLPCTRDWMWTEMCGFSICILKSRGKLARASNGKRSSSGTFDHLESFTSPHRTESLSTPFITQAQPLTAPLHPCSDKILSRVNVYSPQIASCDLKRVDKA